MSDAGNPTNHEHQCAAPVNPRTVADTDRGPGNGRPRIRVPRSNVVVESVPSESNGGQRVIVRCRVCDLRVFDVVGVPADVLVDDPVRCGSLRIVRVCRCGRHQQGRVTGRPGFTLADGLTGRWCCECGSFLAAVDAVRGRVTVPCRRCRSDCRATVADVIGAAQGEAVAQAS